MKNFNLKTFWFILKDFAMFLFGIYAKDFCIVLHMAICNMPPNIFAGLVIALFAIYVAIRKIQKQAS